jgi:hypothetical protein
MTKTLGDLANARAERGRATYGISADVTPGALSA